MAEIFVNNAGAGFYTDEFGVEHQWGVGSDSNSGTSRMAPYATANKIISEYSYNGNNSLVFNEGVYNYTDDGGRWTVVGNMSISGAEDFKTRLVFDGTQNDGMKLSATVSGQAYDIGKIELARANGLGTGSTNIIRHGVSASAASPVNFACRLIITSGIKYGIHGTGRAGVITFKEGFGVASDTPVNSGLSGIVNLSTMANTSLVVESCDVDGYEGTFGTALFKLEYLTHNIGGGISIKGIKGTATVADGGDSTHIVSVEHAPDGATIEINEPLHIIYAGSTNMMGFGIFSKASLGKSADDARIFGSGAGYFTTTATNGVLVRIGDIDNTPHNCANGIIENVVTGATGGIPNVLHGVCHFNTPSGIRRYNKVSGVLMPTLTKLGIAESHNNELRSNVPSNTLTRVLYAKGAGAGTSFHDEKIYIDNSFGGVVECATRDDGGLASTNVTYSDNKIYKVGGDLEASAILSGAGFPGDATDTSTLTSTNLAIESILTLPTNVVQLGSTTYATLLAANGDSAITNMHQYTYVPPIVGIRRYVVDGINGNPNNSAIAAFEGDFSNAVVDIFDAIDKANTDLINSSTDTAIIEVSGGVSGVTYNPTRNLVFTAVGTPYTESVGFTVDNNVLGSYGIVGSKVAGHDGQVIIDASGIVTYDPYDGAISSNKKGTLVENVKIVNLGTSNDAVSLSTCNFSVVRNNILEQGSHAVWAKNSEDVQITGNFVTGGFGTNSSAIKISQQSGAQSTRAIVANNYVRNGGSSAGHAGHFGIQLYGAWDCHVYNNTLINTTSDGIGLINEAKYNKVYNNIVINSIDNKWNQPGPGVTGHDISIDATSTDNEVDHNNYTTNMFYFGGTFTAANGWTGGQRYTSLSSWRSATGYDSNSITDLPQFEGGATPNSVVGIALKKGSKQIQAGVPVNYTKPAWSDFDMTKDVLGVAYDFPPNMGAVALFTWVPPVAEPLTATKDKGTQLMNSLLLNQYTDSTNLKEYLGAYISEMDLLFEQIEEVYIGRFIEYAEGAQLDIIGTILNEGRSVPLPIEFFGFNDEGIPSDTENVDHIADEVTPSDGGVFKSEGQLGTSNFALSDSSYRRLLLAKAYLSTKSVCTANTAYHAISILIGRVPRILKLEIVAARQIELEISSSDTNTSDSAIIAYFGQYLVPLGTTFNVTRI